MHPSYIESFMANKKLYVIYQMVFSMTLNDLFTQLIYAPWVTGPMGTRAIGTCLLCLYYILPLGQAAALLMTSISDWMTSCTRLQHY